MLPSILVPLDRSAFAEQALPLAAAIARRARARLELVQVHALYAMADAAASWCPYDPRQDAEREREERLYLEGVARSLSARIPVEVATAVLPGSAATPETVADSLIERVHAGKCCLAAMATHAPGPFSRFWLGSVADEMVRRCPVPVLLVRPGEETAGPAAEPALGTVLVPLDGSPLAECALAPAIGLARLMGARLTLFRAVEVGGEAKAEAEAYLEEVAGRVREPGLEVRRQAETARHASEAILAAARRERAGLVALATHGRSGFARLLAGSVADEVVRNARLPVLACRAESGNLSL